MENISPVIGNKTYHRGYSVYDRRLYQWVTFCQ